MNTNTTNNNTSSLRLINILSIAIPLTVAVLLGIRTKIDLGGWTKTLPYLIGTVNGLTSVVLLVALVAIKKKYITAHKRLMYVAFGLGAVFLILYITYHISNPSTPYGGKGPDKYIYYFFLITHILLSIGVVRLVLLALHYAINNQFEAHKRIVKWAYPIWLYVSTSGVIVYLMISPYYI